MRVYGNSTGYQMASCDTSPLLSRGEGPLVTQRAETQGHFCAWPGTTHLSWGSILDKDPSSPGGCRELQGHCAALLQPRLERAMIRLARFVCTHTYIHTTHMQPTEQPVFRAPQDYCFDSQGEKIVIERTSDTCVVMSWREDTGHKHTHTHEYVSEQGRCHHNGLMSKELQGEYSGAGYTYRSVRARQGVREKEEDRRINCIHRPWVIQSMLLQ